MQALLQAYSFLRPTGRLLRYYTQVFSLFSTFLLFLCFTDFRLSLAKTDYSLQSANLSPLFSESKKSPTRIKGKRFSPLKRRSESELHLRLADFYLFWAETGYSLPRASLFTLLSESKKRQKIFAAQTPPRKRGFFSTQHTIVGKAFSALPKFAIFARRCSALLDMGFFTKLNYFGASVILYIVIQSTGLTFPTSLPTAR